jgi:hypothetical protein
MLATILFRILCLSVSYQELEDWNIQYYNFNRYFVWVRNLVSHTKEKTQIEGVWEQGAKGNI